MPRDHLHSAEVAGAEVAVHPAPAKVASVHRVLHQRLIALRVLRLRRQFKNHRVEVRGLVHPVATRLQPARPPKLDLSLEVAVKMRPWLQYPVDQKHIPLHRQVVEVPQP